MYGLTPREEQIMNTIWNMDHPCLISEILKASPALKRNTVAPALVVLENKGYLKVDSIGKSYTRTGKAYVAAISKEAYKEYQKNVDNNIKHNNRKDDAFMIQDTCEISKEAMELYEFAKQAVDSAPDIREDKVEDIKNRLDNGTYDVSVEALANKIIGKGCL